MLAPHISVRYYLSRNAVPGADLVLLPYNYLLDPTTRDSLKVRTSHPPPRIQRSNGPY